MNIKMYSPNSPSLHHEMPQTSLAEIRRDLSNVYNLIARPSLDGSKN